MSKETKRKNKKGPEKVSAPELVDFEVFYDNYKTTVNTSYLKRKKYEAVNPNKLGAFMPGSIQKIHVAEGDVVKRGGKLIILEAMKMKNIIAAPFDCKVVKLNVKEGDTVAKNTVLVEVEPFEADVAENA
ncbi:MAG: biotin/lipoyl-binding protein [Bacteroidales bacterium]|nr:biotin/lipoyl-binding protein [Bacteroidales bacterium]